MSTICSKELFLKIGGDCNPADVSVDTSPLLWGLYADDGVSRMLNATPATYGVMVDEGYYTVPYGTLLCYLWLEGTTEYYWEALYAHAPDTNLYVWCGSRSINPNPNGNYSQFTVDVVGTLPFEIFFADRYSYHIGAGLLVQLVNPACVEVVDVQAFLYGLPGTDSVPY
jgi:hypothetical protein